MATKEELTRVASRGDNLAAAVQILRNNPIFGETGSAFRLRGTDAFRRLVNAWDAYIEVRPGARREDIFQGAGPNPDRVKPINMIMNCPQCGERHIDVGEFATKPHHTHACQSCGFVWRPAVECTVGVQFLDGFKNP